MLTSVVDEQSEFERRIGGAMCLMLQHRDHHVPAGGHFVPLLICSTAPIGHGIVTMRKPLRYNSPARLGGRQARGTLDI